MKNKSETAHDQNPARLKILVKRNKKNSRKRRLYLMSFFSTLFVCIALAATRILING